jgi:hypothetical protein
MDGVTRVGNKASSKEASNVLLHLSARRPCPAKKRRGKECTIRMNAGDGVVHRIPKRGENDGTAQR